MKWTSLLQGVRDYVVIVITSGARASAGLEVSHGWGFLAPWP
jgi:hypothetical protein